MFDMVVMFGMMVQEGKKGAQRQFAAEAEGAR